MKNNSTKKAERDDEFKLRKLQQQFLPLQFSFQAKKSNYIGSSRKRHRAEKWASPCSV